MKDIFTLLLVVLAFLHSKAQTYISMPVGYGLDSTSTNFAAYPMIEYNGYVYCVSSSGGYYANSPMGTLAFFKINSATNEVTALSNNLTMTGSPWWNIPVNYSIANGKIFFTYASGIGMINTSTNSVSTIASSSGGVPYYFASATLNKVFFTKPADNYTYVYDISSETVEEITCNSAHLSYPQQFVELNNFIYFFAETGSGVSLATDLYVTSGTSATTFRKIPNSTAILMNWQYRNVNRNFKPFALNGNLIFRSSGATAYTFYSIIPNDGTYIYNNNQITYHNNYTHNFIFNSTSNAGNPAFMLNNNCYLPNFSNNSYYSSGGSTVPVQSNMLFFNGGVTPQSNPSTGNGNILIYQGKAYGGFSDTSSGAELWYSDSTLSGTQLLADINPGSASSNPYYGTVYDNTLFFTATNTSDNIAHLFLSDGTSMGTVCLSTSIQNPSSLIGSGNYIFCYGNRNDSLGIFKVDYKNIFIPQSSATVVGPINGITDYSIGDSLIASITPFGSSTAITGNVTAKVTIDPSVQSYGGQAYLQRHYDIEPVVNPSTSTATLTLYFSQAEFNNYNNLVGAGQPNMPVSPSDAAGISNIRINQMHGIGTAPGNYSGATVLLDPDDSKIVWNNDRSRWEITFDVTGFSGFYITASSIPLPIGLLSFTGTQEGNIDVLKWVTASELNSKGFDIERSSDAVHFDKIGYTASKGNSVEKQFYTFTDIKPLTGRNFYRLRQTDWDGKYGYSKVVALTNDDTPVITLYPNPAADILHITGVPGNTQVQIIDVWGHGIKTIVANGNPITLNISKLSEGTYYCKMEGRGIPFVKQNR